VMLTRRGGYAYLLAAAHAALGDRVLGVIADSASLPRQALKEALEVAGHIGARVEVVATEELQDERYASNPVNRCYFCKAELFTKLEMLTRSGVAAIAYGKTRTICFSRAGRMAAQEFRVIAPLRDAGLTKAEIRNYRGSSDCRRRMRRRSRVSPRASRMDAGDRPKRWG